MKLLYKFFLAFFVTNLTLVGLMLALIAVNLSYGFNEFIIKAENSHVAKAKQQLIALYQQQNSWQPIINDVQIWRDIVDPQAKRPPPPRREPPRQERDNKRPRPVNDLAGRPKPPPPRGDNPADFLKTGKRLSLYDNHQNVIVGKQHLADNPHTESIEVDGETVGWLGLEPSNVVKDSPASEFLAQQYETYYLITAAVILMAFIMALLFSKHLVAPIKLIISGTGKLIAGNYSSRIKKTTSDELGVLSDNFNVLAQTLEKNQSNRFQWMSDTSHELRTPLTVLRSHLIAIQDGIFSADEKRVQLFIDQIDNLSHIVDDLYQLSSSDAGGLTYKKIDLNPVKLFVQVIENFKPKFEQHSLTVDYSSLTKSLKAAVADNRCNLLGDKERLRQLFANLLENCCRYTQAPGKIIISVKIDKGHLEFNVEDSAPGVSSEEQPKLFERFYRVDKSRNRSHGGSGLGLALCKQIVEAHQGTIAAKDSSLGGLRITMTFALDKKLNT